MVCDDKRFGISAGNKKEVYCQGGTPKDYNVDVKACVDQKANDIKWKRFLENLVFLSILIGALLFLCLVLGNVK